MFHIWGDLEERIAAQLPHEEDNEAPPSSNVSDLSTTSQLRRAGDQPDPDDSDNDRDIKMHTSSSPPHIDDAQTDPVTAHVLKEEEKDFLAPKNKPFTCCIQQYGVQVPEKDPSKADAGNKKRWQRIFSIFGTTIPK